MDLDLEKFFEKVNHIKLIEVLSRTVMDRRAISLKHKYVLADVHIGGHIEISDKKVLQGGPLSLLWGNNILNELDKELER